MRLGRMTQLFAPGYSWCARCKTSWRFIEPHCTMYMGTEGANRQIGAFALCEQCWQEVSTKQRVMYYADRFADRDEWPLILAAVEAGK